MATSAAKARKMPSPVQREIPGTPPLILSGLTEAVRNEDDITLHIRHKAFVDAANIVFNKDPIPYKTPTIDLSGQVTLADLPDSGLPKSSRLHAALSFAGEYYSVTIRAKKQKWCDWPKPNRLNGEAWNDLKGFLAFASLNEKHWELVADKYLATLCGVADKIFPIAFPKNKAHAGLVLVTGGTGSGKTTVLNGLLARYLGSLFKPGPIDLDRRPHVLAIGDPVETAFYADSLSESAKQQVMLYGTRPIDFTARVIKTDTPSVEAALEDALRETTTALVVSELRRDEDFRATLKFAATGQLVFATAHNTSLVDALRKLMMFSGKDGPSNRSLLAQRLKVVIHLQKMDIGGKSVTLPSVWLANSPGIRNFVSDGLSSLLPHGTEGQDVGVLGLAWAAQKLCNGNIDLLREAHRRDLPIR